MAQPPLMEDLFKSSIEPISGPGTGQTWQDLALVTLLRATLDLPTPRPTVTTSVAFRQGPHGSVRHCLRDHGSRPARVRRGGLRRVREGLGPEGGQRARGRADSGLRSPVLRLRPVRAGRGDGTEEIMRAGARFPLKVKESLPDRSWIEPLNSPSGRAELIVRDFCSTPRTRGDHP